MRGKGGVYLKLKGGEEKGCLGDEDEDEDGGFLLLIGVGTDVNLHTSVSDNDLREDIEQVQKGGNFDTGESAEMGEVAWVNM